MKIIGRTGLVAMLMLCGFLANMEGQEKITVVPYPQEVFIGKGSYQPGDGSLGLRVSGLEGRSVDIMEAQLREAYAERYQADLFTGKKADIWIGIPEQDEELMALARKKGIIPGKELGEEGYLLSIEKKKIYILANAGAGVFYGVQSLKQMLRGNPAPGELPVVSIRDWPSIEFRCVMDDISRGPIPRSDYLKLQVRRYAEMKINHMSFYIEHVVQTEKYPDMAPAEGGIPVEEFRELSEYAADYHVKLVGNFQSLGHFEKILSLPQFRHLGATERMLDPLNPATIDFLADIYGEMAPAFSSPWFSPNCDEAWDLSRGSLSGPAADLGVSRIYANHITAIDSVLRSLGKRSLVWGDIVLEHPDILEMIPGDVVMGAWNYSPSESFAEFIDPLTKAGFDFMIAPGVLNSNRLIPDFRMSTTNIRNFINEGYEKGTLGVYFTAWDDGGLHFFSHDWYAVGYMAEQSWRPNREALEDYDKRFSLGIYGDPANTIPRALHTLNQLTDLGPTFEMNSNVFYKTLVPERGTKVTFNPGEWEEVQQWTGKSSEILSYAELPYYAGDLDFLRFTTAQYDFMAESRNSLLQMADAYQRACALQRQKRPEALEELKGALQISGALIQEFAGLKAEMLELWDLESRAHWRDRAEESFVRHQDALAAQQALLLRATEGFQDGAYLPPPTDLRLDIRRQAGQYFQYWLLAGSFHLESFDDHATDFLIHMGGESAARPFPGQKFKDPGGKDYMWMKYDSPKLGELDFKTIFEPHITAVAYAYCTIDAPKAMEVTGLLGSNDGATVWLNGQHLHHVHVKRSLIPDEDEIPLNLQEGRNHLLIKVEQWKAGWGLSFRLKDVDVRNHKQKYYIQ